MTVLGELMRDNVLSKSVLLYRFTISLMSVLMKPVKVRINTNKLGTPNSVAILPQFMIEPTGCGSNDCVNDDDDYYDDDDDDYGC